MKAYYASLLNEIQKQLSKKKTYVLLGIASLIPIGTALLAAYFQGGLGVAAVRSQDFPIYVLGIFTKLLLPLFIFMLTADIFAGEINDRTIRASLLRPVTKLRVYTAKLSCTGIYILAFLALIYIVSVMCGVFLGIGPGFLTGILAAFGQYLAAFLPLFLLGIVSSFIALLAGGASGALVLSLLAFVTVKTAGLVFPGISGYLFTSYTDWYLMLSSGTVSLLKLAGVFMFILSYSIIFLGSGYLLFERKEL